MKLNLGFVSILLCKFCVCVCVCVEHYNLIRFENDLPYLNNKIYQWFNWKFEFNNKLLCFGVPKTSPLEEEKEKKKIWCWVCV